MPSKVDRFVEYDGVLSIRAHKIGTTDVLRAGESEHDVLLTAACEMLIDHDLPSLRVILAKRTINVERTAGGWIVATVTVTGNAIGKHLFRMLRREFGPEKPKREPRPKNRKPRPSRAKVRAAARPGDVGGIEFEIDLKPQHGVFSPMRKLTPREEYETT
jgi:hypothetical protein